MASNNGRLNYSLSDSGLNVYFHEFYSNIMARACYVFM